VKGGVEMLDWTASLKQKRAHELERTVVGRLRRKRLPEAMRAEECPIERTRDENDGVGRLLRTAAAYESEVAMIVRTRFSSPHTGQEDLSVASWAPPQ